jgi:hypothetical protein
MNWQHNPESKWTGAHAIRIIGYGVYTCNGEMTDYWLLANSWGATWNGNGTIRFLRGENVASIESSQLSWGYVHFPY